MVSPWDLQTALNQPSVVNPGDTIWLRGGTHSISNRPTKFISQLSGADGQPITVRQYPGERATVDGNIMQTSGGWVNYWGFEIMNSQQFGLTNFPTRLSPQPGPFPTTWYINYNGRILDFTVSGFDLRAPNCKLINLIVHDNIGGGIGIDIAAGNTETYGCLSYFNGWQGLDRAHGHGLYGQNADPAQKSVTDCIVFNNFALGMQATGAGPTPIADNFDIEGNAFFLNGALAASHQANLLVGPFQGVAKNPVIRTNFIYDTQGTGSDFNLGNSAGALVQGNYFQTSVMLSTNINLIMEGNTFVSGILRVDPCTYPNNSYLINLPTSNFIAIRPNKYEPGRANIIVYNWENLNSVSVDASGFLPIGTAFEVRNAQDFFGSPVLTGTYDGTPLDIPLTGLSVAQPIGIAPPPSSGPAFGAFIVLPLNAANSALPRTSKAKTSQKVYIPVEAGAGKVTAPMRLVRNTSSPARQFASSRTAKQGSIVFNIEIPVSGTYVIWAKVFSPTPAHGSFFVSVDGGSEDLYDNLEGKWSSAWPWTLVNSRGSKAAVSLDGRRFDLVQGPHSITFRAQEAASALNRILVTDDLAFMPKDIVAPTQTLPAPANSTTRFNQNVFLCNATNLFGDSMTLSIPTPYTSQRGIVSISGKEVLYTPRQGFLGNDRFTYLLTTVQGDSSAGTVMVRVQSSAVIKVGSSP